MESESNIWVEIKSLSTGEFARDSLINVRLCKGTTDEFAIDCQLGSHRSSTETNRASIIALRDALNQLLAVTEPEKSPEPALHMELSDEAYDNFERQLEQRPMSTNLSLQRLLRRKPTWEQ